jgi:hypothetical protein
MKLSKYDERYEMLARRPQVKRRFGTSVVAFPNRKYRLFLDAAERIVFEIAINNNEYLWQM